MRGIRHAPDGGSACSTSFRPFHTREAPGVTVGRPKPVRPLSFALFRILAAAFSALYALGVQTTLEQKYRPGRHLGLALAGLLLGISGVIGYFALVFRLGAALPSLRNSALLNWIGVALGLALSGLAVTRTAAGRRTVPSVLLGLNVVVAGLFSFFLYGMLAVPPADGPAVGVPAPDFALSDQTGKTVRLAD